MNFRKLLIEISDFSYYRKLETELSDCKSVLDLGCGKDSPLRKVRKTIYKVGVDIFKPSIEESKSKGIHSKYKLGNVLEIHKFFKKNSFDAVIALDLIEHFDRKDAEKLIKRMEKIAKKKIIVLTPNGFTKQVAYENNPFQEHKSGWTVDDFLLSGFKIWGMRGIKYLRGGHASLKYKPWFIFGIISTFSELLVYNFPRFAYQIFAVKYKSS